MVKIKEGENRPRSRSPKFFTALKDIFKKKEVFEKSIDTDIYTAPCGQKSRLNLYFYEEGYDGNKCRECGGKAFYRFEILSPVGDDVFPFGSHGYCKKDLPDIHKVAKSHDLFDDIILGKLKK